MLVPDRPGIAFQILGAVAQANIDVDDHPERLKEGITDFSFTVHRNDYNAAASPLKDEAVPRLARDVMG